MLFGKNSGAEDNGKRTVASELKKNMSQSVDITRNIRESLAENKNGLKLRRKKGYAVEEGVTREEFEKSFRNFSWQITIYLAVFFLSIAITPFATTPAITALAAIYTGFCYIIYIRDVHRGRMVLANWELRHTPMPLTWKEFFNEVRQSPKFLIPLIK